VKYVNRLIVLAFFGIALFRVGYNASHPELTDWQYHPAWSVGILLVLAFVAGVFLWAWRKDRLKRNEEDPLKKGRRR
jgi:hypothetical protein